MLAKTQSQGGQIGMKRTRFFVSSILEGLAGSIPQSLRVFWEVVGCVDLIGFCETLPEYFDPLVVFPVEVAIEEYSTWKEWCEYDRAASVGSYGTPIAPDYHHKDNVSGGSPYGIGLPSSSIGAPLENQWHATTFADYLRACFRWGGFPRFERVKSTIPPELRESSKQLLML